MIDNEADNSFAEIKLTIPPELAAKGLGTNNTYDDEVSMGFLTGWYFIGPDKCTAWVNSVIICIL